jgi:chromosome segregation ATPase
MAENNTDMYGLKNKFFQTKKNVNSTVSQVSEYANTTNEHKEKINSISDAQLKLSERVENLEKNPIGVSFEQLINEINKFSNDNLEPVINDIVSDLEALQIQSNIIKKELDNMKINFSDIQATRTIDAMSVSEDIKPRVIPQVKSLNINRRLGK